MADVPFASNRFLFYLLVAFFVSALVARALSHIADRIGLVDEPGGRKQHEGRTPITGGLGMYAGYFAAVLASGLVTGPTLALIVALGLLVFAGAADDMHDIRPTT